jgi:hypothetical protein
MNWEASLRHDVRTKLGKGWNVRLNGGSAQLVYRKTINYKQQTDSLRLKEIEWTERNHSKILEICALLADRKKTHNMTLKAAYRQLQRRIRWIIERNSSLAISTFASSEVKLDDIKNYCLMARRWAGVISRCHDPTDPNFYAYGARGISVCEEWFNFDNFLRFWQAPPFEGAQFGRINNDGNYEPSNCEWQDQTAQNRNKRTTRFLTYKGETRPLWQWAMEYNVGQRRLWERLKRGWTVKRALETPCPKGFEKERQERTEKNKIEWSVKGHLYAARSQHRRGLELGLLRQELLAVEGAQPQTRQ